MPDVHWGMGATIGSVIATRGAVIPAAVGVDLGCGMMAQRTTLRAVDLPDTLHALRTAIEAAIPHGRTDNGRENDRGAWGEIPPAVANAWTAMPMDQTRATLTERQVQQATRQLGTLGTGNHFIEVCLDEGGFVWIMLHSGSRGIGNSLASEFIARAKATAAKYFYEENLPDKDLAFLPEGTPDFKEYVAAVLWAQDYAYTNRTLMMMRATAVLRNWSPVAFDVSDVGVSCHHNYLARENHFGQNVLVTRKGAVSAKDGELGIIPGSMGAKSFIVRGKGERESFHSCSHGAGRRMGRNEAKKRISMERFAETMVGVESRQDAAVLDEAPDAYKSIDAVIAAESDLIEVVHTLKQVVCIKG
jgi:tRNA-splicing ligase RtcB